MLGALSDAFPDARFAIEDRIVAEADHVIAECPQEEEDLIRYYNADPARTTIVPGGFDPAEFWPIAKPLARVTLGLPPHEPIVLQLGRLVPRKGVDTAIRGLARLREEHGIAARLLIVGGDANDPDPSVTPEIGRLQALYGQWHEVTLYEAAVLPSLPPTITRIALGYLTPEYVNAGTTMYVPPVRAPVVNQAVAASMSLVR